MESDISLLLAARRLDTVALTETFDLYAPALYRYALHLCQDPLLADSIVGNVFARLLDQLACGRGPTTNVRAYLFQCTYHLVIDEARYSKRRVPLEEVDSARHTAHSVWQESEDHILLEAIARIIREDLTENQRHVILLRFMEGFSLKETALILGLPVNTIKVTQNRAIGNLRKALVA